MSVSAITCPTFFLHGGTILSRTADRPTLRCWLSCTKLHQAASVLHLRLLIERLGVPRTTGSYPFDKSPTYDLIEFD